MTEPYESSERVQTGSGQQYHLGIGPGQVASNLVLVGDPARAERWANRLDRVDHEVRHREYATFTGTWRDLPVSLMATGIGCDNTEIAVVELGNLLPDATIIRAGTCGALDPTIRLGDLIVTWGAVRLESTSTYFVPEGYPAVAHPDVIQALRSTIEEAGVPQHFGMTATAPGFYGAQGRNIPGFPPRYPDLVDDLARIGVKNLEMETSTLLTLASLRGYRAGAVCTAFAQRNSQAFVAPADRIPFEDRAVECALNALLRLAK